MLLRLGAIGESICHERGKYLSDTCCLAHRSISSLLALTVSDSLEQYMHSQRFDSRDGHVCGNWCKIPVADVQHSAWKCDALG
jgi:hypothetical protein